jgi:hypothetical protein
MKLIKEICIFNVINDNASLKGKPCSTKQSATKCGIAFHIFLASHACQKYYILLDQILQTVG